MVSQNGNTGSTNVLGAGTLRLIATTDGPANPDLNFGPDANGVLFYGAQIDMATLDLGATQRYIYATSSHNSVAVYRNQEDARINGNIIGSGGITYVAQNNNAGANGNQPMECPLVLGGGNTFAGELEIQRGSVYLLNPNALTQTNQLLLDPVAGHNAKFFIYGNSTTVANLASGGMGNTLIANGNVENNTAPIPAATLTIYETYEYDAYNPPQYTSGSLALNKIGPATLNLTGASTYTGPTTISAGTLAVNGSLASPVTVSAGATLAGTGTLTGPVIVNGTNAPGNGSVGTLTTGSETWNASGCLVFTVTNATTSEGTSLLNINGALNVAATPANPFVIHLASLTASQIPGPAGGFNPANAYTWPLATTSGGIMGFAPGSVVVDASGVANAFKGVFSVAINGNTLELNYGEAVAAPPGLVAWWPANGNAVDVVGGNNGTLTNSTAYGTGEVGQAFHFNGSSAMVLLANTPALQLQTFTIETWLQRGSATSVTMDGSAVAGNTLFFGYGHSGYSLGMSPNGNPLLTWVDHNDVVCSAAITDTDWHHVAVTTTNGTVVFYIDGTAYPVTGTYNPGYTFGTAPALGGRADNINQPNNDSFLGSLDELSVYNAALTPAQILAIYDAGAGGKYLTTSANIVTGPITNPQTGHSYAILAPGSWTQAQAEAHALGGHLATIRSQAENNWITNNLLVNFQPSGGPNLSHLPLWIGLYDPTSNDGSGSQHTADFIWDSGETYAYRNWNSGEPNNTGILEYYTAINWNYAAGYSSTPGTWNDTPLNGSTGYAGTSSGPYYGIVEFGTGIPPIPTVPGAVYGPVVSSINGHEYYIVPLNNWSNAQTAALALGGNLATIRSAAENSWIVTNMLADLSILGGPNLTVLPVWIGLYDPERNDGAGPSSAHAANFIWVSGDPATYRNWNPSTSEPNNQNNNEYFTAINWQFAQGTTSDHSVWDDTPFAGTTGQAGTTDGPYYGIAEVSTSPGTPPSPVISSFGGNLTLAWPATGTYSVQQTTNLVAPGSWVPSTYSVSTRNGTNYITFTAPASGNLFFRLSNP
jgi:autotransporter-associated beta strand protein